MSEKFNGVVTATGVSLISQAIEANTKLQFLSVIASTTQYTDDQLPTLTDDELAKVGRNQSGHISNIQIKGDDTVYFEVVLDGNSISADYSLNSVLILARVGTTDHLFAVLKANQPQYMNAYDGKSATNLQINVGFKIANTNAIALTVDHAGLMTALDYQKIQEYTDTQVAGQTVVHTTKDETVDGVKTFKQTIQGNATSADKFSTARKINGVGFDGSQDITIADGTAAHGIDVNGGPVAKPGTDGVVHLTLAMPSLAPYAKSATVNGSTPVNVDANGNLPLTVPNPNLEPYLKSANADGKYQAKGNYATSATVNGGAKVDASNGTLALTVPNPNLDGLATHDEVTTAKTDAVTTANQYTDNVKTTTLGQAKDYTDNAGFDKTSDVDNKIASTRASIPGINLLPGTATFDGWTFTDAQKLDDRPISNPLTGQAKGVDVSGIWSGAYAPDIWPDGTKQYIFSVYANCDAGLTADTWPHIMVFTGTQSENQISPSATQEIDAFSNVKRCYWLFSVPSGYLTRMRVEYGNADAVPSGLVFWGYQLEVDDGSHLPHPYAPAPTDTVYLDNNISVGDSETAAAAKAYTDDKVAGVFDAGKGQTLPAGVDFDTLQTPGLYDLNGLDLTKCHNAPPLNDTEWGYFVVRRADGVLYQFFQQGIATPSSYFATLYRILSGSPASWADWIQFATAASVTTAQNTANGAQTAANNANAAAGRAQSTADSKLTQDQLAAYLTSNHYLRGATMTQAAYDALGNKDPNFIYAIEG